MIRFLLAFLTVFSFMPGCGGVSSGDDRDIDDRQRRRGGYDRNRDDDRNRDRERGQSENESEFNFGEDGDDSFDDSLGDGFSSPFQTTNEEEETPLDGDEGASQTSVSLVEPLKQEGISNKIDFLFIVDSSPKNEAYITSPHLQEKIGLLPIRLDNINVDWRFFFVNSQFDAAKGRNGKLLNLEFRTALIRSQYLDHTVAEFWANDHSPSSTYSHIFVDTLELPPSGNKESCKKPPHCYSDKENRPLKVLHHFLRGSKNLLRDGADFFVVILTNRDEAQPKNPSKANAPVEAPQIVDRFSKIHPGKKFYVTSIVAKAGDDICKEQNKHNVFASYIPQLSMLTGGRIISICSEQSSAYSDPIIRWIQKQKQKQ